MREGSAATADSATKLSADEPGEAEHESILAKTGHLNRDHGLGRGAPFASVFACDLLETFCRKMKYMLFKLIIIEK